MTAFTSEFSPALKASTNPRLVGGLSQSALAALGEVQAHHLFNQPAVNNNPIVNTFLTQLEAAGKYNHNGTNNMFWMPESVSASTQNPSSLTGVAKHYGSNVASYTNYVRDGLLTFANDFNSGSGIYAGKTQIEKLAIAEKQIVAFQNHLRGQLTVGFEASANLLKQGMALQTTDPWFSTHGGTNPTFSTAALNADPHYSQALATGVSNFDDKAFKLAHNNELVTATERARARLAIDATHAQKAGLIPFLNKVAQADPALARFLTGKNLNPAEAGFGKFQILLMITAAVGVMQFAMSNPAAAQSMYDKVASHMSAGQLAADAFHIAQGIATEAGKYMATYYLAGAPGTLALVALDTYQLGRAVIKIFKASFPDNPILNWLDTNLDAFEGYLKAGANIIAQTVVKMLGFTELLYVDGDVNATSPFEGKGGAGDQLMWVTGKANVDGEAGKDWIFHLGKGEARGGADNDLLVAWKPKAENGAATLTLYGDDGDDVIITLGGDGAYSYGGAGKDMIVAWSGEDHVWGGSGPGNTPDGEEDWFIGSHKTFIHDAGPEDFVFYGPLRVNGGVQSWFMETGWASWRPLTGLVSGMPLPFLMAFGALAPMMMLAVVFDVLASLLFQFYRTTSGQLVIQTALGFGHMIIEDYDLDLETGRADGSVVVFKQEIREGAGSLASINQYINLALKQGFGRGLNGKDPLILDLDGDGYELVRRDASDVYFDLDGDNFAERAAWVGPDDAFLARDLNGNGTIDNITEMFGTEATPGLTALAALDSNGDGKITAADAAFGTLRVWRDADGDGVTDAGELRTLAEVGITEISLTSTTPGTTVVRGNTIRAEATFTRADGSTSKVGDVLLETFEADSRWLGDATISTAAAALPELKGYGNVVDLRIAMTDDATLLALVAALDALPANATWAQIKDATDDILFRWAGVDGVAATPFASGTFDERRLAFLEKYTGETLVPRDGQGHPTAINAEELVATWNDMLDRAAIRLAAQGPWAARYTSFAFEKAPDTFLASTPTSLADVYSATLAALPTDPTAAAAEWSASAGPALAAFNRSATRADQNGVRKDYIVQALVRATTATSTTLTLAQLVVGLALEGVQVGTAAAETLTRNATGPLTQVYVGGAGNDRLEGGAGQDVFVFGSGFGNDRIVDGEYAENGDRIRLAMLNPNEVTIARVGNDLVITVIATGETITVEGQYARPTVVLPWMVGSQPGFGVEDIQFADGTIYEAGQIALAVGQGTNGNDTITGSYREDAIKGLLGNDILRGGDSGDLYFYYLGDGHDTIDEQRTDVFAAGQDTLLLGNITSETVTLSRVGSSADIKLTFTDGGSVTLLGQAAYSPLGYSGYDLDHRVENIFFQDGPVWNWLELQQQVIQTYTTPGADTTYGFGTPDTMYSSAGDDFLSALDGNDTYQVDLGTGHDTISDDSIYVDTPFSGFVGGIGAQEDRIVFGSGILKADITYRRLGAAPDLEIAIANTTDLVTVIDQFVGIKLDLFGLLGIAWFDRIERFEFADGTFDTWEDVLRTVTTGDAGDNALYGAYYRDIIDGKAGNDFLSGNNDGDTYIFGRGYGNDIVDDSKDNILTATADTVKFNADIAVGDITFTHVGRTDDLLLTVAGSTDTLLIKNQYDIIETGPFGTQEFDQIERFEWSNGTVKTWDVLAQEIIAASKTTGADLIVGTHFDDFIDGGAGNDQLEGGNGSDTYFYDRGYGNDTVYDLWDNILADNNDRILFGSQIAPGDLLLEREGAGLLDLRVTIAATGEWLKIIGQFDYTTIAYKPTEIAYFEFSNGTIWTKEQVRQKYIEQHQTTGADIVEGFFSNDTITGGLGNDTLRGQDGADTYVFGAGFGQDRIEESVGYVTYDDTDVVSLSAAFTEANTTLTRIGNDLRIGFTNASDTILVVGQFNSAAWFGSWTDIERIAFDSGAIWNEADIRQKLLAQSSTGGNDVIQGFYTSDILDGGAGNDTLRGSSGSDTYIFNIGHGQDIVEESLDDHPFIDGPDTIQFGAGIATTQVAFTRSGNDLVATVSPSGDTIKVRDHFISGYKKVEFFKFADGTTVTAASAEAGSVAAQSTSGNDTIIGTNGVDTIDGGAGNDILRGGDGADTYQFAPGGGQDQIEEGVGNVLISDEDTLVFAAGIAKEDITISRTPTLRDLKISIAGSTDQVIVKGQFDSAAWYGSWTDIERFVFADGSSWSTADLRIRLLDEVSTSGNDTIDGFYTPDVIEGGAGDDVLRGSSGGDTYLFSRGDGNDTIFESLDDHPFIDGPDKLKFGDSISRSDVAFTRSGNDLVATVNNGGGSVRINNHYGSGYAQVETFEFADATSITVTEAALDALNAQFTSGDDLVIGASTAEVFNAGLGNDTIRGGNGGDTYNFRLGDGQDRIEETDGEDAIVFGPGIEIDDIVLTRSASLSDLTLSITGTTDSVVVAGQFVSAAWFGSWTDVEQIRFADGTIWTDNDIRLMLLANARTSGNDTIYGYWTADIIDGGAGNDILRGSSGSDAYVFDRGYGQDTIYESLDDHPFVDGPDTIRFGQNLPEADVVFTRQGNDLLVTVTGTTDTLRVVGQFAYNGYIEVENVEFASGRTLTREEVEQLVVTAAATTGNETIIGYRNAEILSGLAGNDILSGYGGGDTYEYALGFGQDIVEDNGASTGDVVRFKAGILPGDVTWTSSGNDVIATFAGSPGDRLTLKGQLQPGANPEDRIESVEFDNNTSLTHTQIAAMFVGGETTAGVTIAGTPGIDVLNGTNGNDVFGGGRAADFIYTTVGNDTFVWTKGDGNDWIDEESGSNVEIDTLHLLDVSAADLRLTHIGTDLFIDIISTGERIEIDEHFYSTANNYGIEQIRFADNSVWDRNQINAETWYRGTAAAETINGSGFNDTIHGAGGADTLNAGGGSDTYVFAGGDGSDIIEDYSGSTVDVDRLRLTNLNEADVRFARLGSHLYIDVLATGERLSIYWQFYSTTENWGFEVIQFANANTWDRARIQTEAWFRGTAAAEAIAATAAADMLQGFGGADTLRGAGGSDTYVFASGDGNDLIDEDNGSTVDVDKLWLTNLNEADVRLSRSGSHLLLDVIPTGERMTINWQFYSTTANWGLEQIQFAGGAIWDRARIATESLQIVGTAGDDTLVGTANDDAISGLDGNDTITGLGGNDNISGGNGNDAIDGGAGTDTMTGGAGNDAYTVDVAGDVVTEVAGGGTDTVQTAITYTLSAEVENLVLTGTGAVNGTGNVLANSLTGNSGANILDGGAGVDAMAGGTGNDTYVVDNAGDTVTEAAAAGTDVVQASVTYTLSAEVETLVLTGAAAINGTGNALNNTMTGNSGDNTLDGGAGNDAMTGGAGNDTYLVDSATDTAVEVAAGGTDTVRSSVTFTLGTEVENLVLIGAAAINGTGNALVNSLTGNGADNTLNGGAGIDTMIGGAGNDTYVVDVAGETITELAGGGTDTVQAGVTWTLGAELENLVLTGSGAINATGNGLTNSLTGNTGANILDGGAGADAMAGGTGNDTYVVDNAGDTVTEAAAAGTDIVQASVSYTLSAEVETLVLTGTAAINGTGNALNNTMTGNSGNNTLDGGAGNDAMTGGAGNDTYLVDSTTDTAVEVAAGGTDTVQSSATFTLGTEVEHLVLIGAAAINGTGNALANTLTGNGADNTLTGGAGIDTMIGGAGNDTYVVDVAGETLTELAGGGTDTVRSAVAWTLAAEFENLVMTGASAVAGTGNGLANTLDGSQNSAVNALSGGLGDDIYIVGTGDTVTEAAGAGLDTVRAGITHTIATNVENLELTGTGAINGTGNAGVNRITGNSGNNILSGLAGADTMIGGLGNDTYVVDNAGDVVTELAGQGTDLVQTSVTLALLAAEVENVTLTGTTAINATGNGLANVMTGNTANNTLNGGAGNDTIDGGTGNDTMIGGLGDDIFVVNVATDIVTEAAGEGTDTIRSSVTLASLAVNVENLILTGSVTANGTGNGLANSLTGSTGVNTLSGGAGADRLDGLAGVDTLTGGTEGDTFVFKTGYGRDIVTDFTAGTGLLDVVEFSLGTAFDTFAEILAAATQSGANTLITIDVNTSLTLNNVQRTALVADDFRFV